MRMILQSINALLLFGFVVSGYALIAQKANDKLVENQEPIPTPAETNHIMITYNLEADGVRGVYIYFGNNKVDLIRVPKVDLNELNGKKMWINDNGVVASYVLDLLNRYEKEGFELISTESYVPVNPISVGSTSPSWMQCFLRRKK